jgi:hypothetical protein
MNDSIYSRSKPLHRINIWNDNIGNEVNDSRLVIPITNTINIEHYNFLSDFVIQSRKCIKPKITNFKRRKFYKIFIFYDDGKI